MSYILDALRRAEAERARGAVPGLHAQSLPTDGEPAARRFGPLVGVVASAAALVVAATAALVLVPRHGGGAATAADVREAAVQQLAQQPQRMQLTSELTQGALPAPQADAIVPAARPIEPPIGRGNAVQAYTPPQQAQPQSQQQTQQQTQRPRETAGDRAASGRVATLEPRAQAAAATRAPVEHYGEPIAGTPAPANARSAAVSSINDLPPGVRAQLPRLTVGGAIYSDTPSARMVILNGQVFHEGDKPAADTVLEQIRLKSAVLSFRGQRYEVSF